MQIATYLTLADIAGTDLAPIVEELKTLGASTAVLIHDATAAISCSIGPSVRNQRTPRGTNECATFMG